MRRSGGFYACSTNTFKINYYEPPSGLRFIVTTDLAAGDMRESLRHIYSNIYVECLVKNPLWRPDEELTCPLTFELMVDPVVTADGQTYERKAIEQWLATHDTSPSTGEKLKHKALTPNVAFRGMCRKLAEASQRLASPSGV